MFISLSCAKPNPCSHATRRRPIFKCRAKLIVIAHTEIRNLYKNSKQKKTKVNFNSFLTILELPSNCSADAPWRMSPASATS